MAQQTNNRLLSFTGEGWKYGGWRYRGEDGQLKMLPLKNYSPPEG